MRRGPLLAVTAIGALLRFGTLDAKSFWEDEGLTVQILHRSFGTMLTTVSDSDPNPPLYYAIAWVWARVAGFGEIGLRSLSALAGTLTIPVAYLIVRTFGTRRAALFTAALVAVNPFLVWYSQEARTYPLFGFFGALSMLFFARALKDGRRRDYGLWLGACVLTALTHYFAIFTIAAEAGWLLWVRRHQLRRGVAIAVVAVPAAAAAVAAAQVIAGPASKISWSGPSGVGLRVVTSPAELLMGFEAPQRIPLAAVAGIVIATALAWLPRAPVAARRGAYVALSVAAFAYLVPLAAALIGLDYLASRNLTLVLVPVLAAAGAGLAAGPGRAPWGVFAVLAVVSVATIGLTARTPKYGSQDWRPVAAAMGDGPLPRVVVLAPGFGAAALDTYVPGGLRDLRPPAPPVREVIVVATTKRRAGQTGDLAGPEPAVAPRIPAPGFRLTETVRGRYFTLLRFTSARPRRVSKAVVVAGRFAADSPEAFVEPLEVNR